MPDDQPRKRRRFTKEIAIAEVAVFSAAAVAARSERGRELDDAIFRKFNRGLAPFRPVFWLITQGGWFGSVVVWCGICLWRGRRRLAFDILGAALLSWVLSQAGKEIVALERPWERLDGTHRIGGVPWGSSFPSGHPSVSFAVAGSLAADEDVPRALKRLAHSWAVAVAISRMVVGAHYPLDVIGGAALGDLAAQIWIAAAPGSTSRKGGNHLEARR